MKLSNPLSLQALGELLGAKTLGDPKLEATGINEIHVVEPGDIAFVDHPKYYDKTLSSEATIIIIDKEVECPKDKGLVVHEKPFAAFNALIRHHYQVAPSESMIHPTAQIGEGCIIQPNVFIGPNAVVGAGCVLHPGAVIGAHCQLGQGVVVQANTVIGGDGFYYKKTAEGYDRLLSCGRVVLLDRVEIGAGCTIDRGVTSDTRIGVGTKIDNQVHIGHDTVIGKDCLIAAQVGISGCVKIEDRVTIWGQVGIIANVTIAEGTTILAQSGIGKSTEPGKSYLGSPATDARKRLKEMATVSRLAIKGGL